MTEMTKGVLDWLERKAARLDQLQEETNEFLGDLKAQASNAQTGPVQGPERSYRAIISKNVIEPDSKRNQNESKGN